MVIAKQDITIFRIVEVDDVTRYYTLSDDWPNRPTTNPPSDEWSETEPNTSFEGSASGTSLAITDISPVEHNMTVKVSCKNLINEKALLADGFVDEGDCYSATYQQMSHRTNMTPDIKFKPNTVYVLSYTAKQEAFNGVYGAPRLEIRYTDGTGQPTGVISKDEYARRIIYSNPKKTVAGIYSNYGTKSIIRILKNSVQLEEGSAVTAYTPYVSDLSSIKMMTIGKNLIPYPYRYSSLENNGITFTANDDGAIVANGTATDITKNAQMSLNAQGTAIDIQKDIYTISCGFTQQSNRTATFVLDFYLGGTWKFVHYVDNNTMLSKTIDLRDKEFDSVFAYVRIPAGVTDTFDNFIFKPQLELGSTASDYDLYVAPTTYAASADGTVPNVKSLYPVTTLMTNPEGVIINADYYKDLSESLYFTDLTTYTDDTFKYSEVSKSSDYEAAKDAFNEAIASGNAAQNAYDAADNMNAALTKTIAEQYSAIETNLKSITETVSKVETTIDDTKTELNDKISTLQQQVSMQITEEAVDIQIEKKLQNGVTKVDTTTGFTFDENGLNISKTNSPTNTQITENGMTVNKTETGDAVLTANKDGVDAVNLRATTYLIVGKRSRFEDYEPGRTGCFWIGE